MNTHRDPRELVIDLLNRSPAKVQVSAVLSDNYGIFSWGWNFGNGDRGIHAEMHAINRANKNRLRGAKLTVAGRRKRTRKFVYSKPCDSCMDLVFKYGIRIVEYITKDGNWETIKMF